MSELRSVGFYLCWLTQMKAHYTPSPQPGVVDGIYRSDYSSTVPRLKSFFIHEMAHVYQYQLKILNPVTAAISEAIQHGFNYDKAYQYMLDAKKDLLDYDIEQQAQIIEDYYRVHYLGLNPVAGFIQNNVAQAKNKGLYSKVLSKFLRDPSYARHKIECQWTKRGPTRRRICTRVIVK